MKPLLLILLLASPACGQVLQVAGGASTITDAQGLTATFYTPKTTNTFSIGASNGALVGGLQTKFNSRGCEMVLGDQQIFLTSGEGGLSAATRGVSCKRKHWAAFAGAIGRAYSAPFFSGTQAKDFGAGLSYNWNFKSLQTGGVLALTSGRKTALETLVWRHNQIRITGTGGLLESNRQFGGRAEWLTPQFAAALSRDTYISNGIRATATSEGFSSQFGPVGLHASAFQGKAHGETFGASIRAGFLQVDANEFLSPAGKTFSASTIQHLSQRWTIAQYFTRSGGNTSLNFGGGYTGNVASITASYQQMFFPFSTAVPFQKVLSVQIALQLPHSTSAHMDLQAAPGQSLKWTGYGTSYLQTGVEIAGQPHVARISGFAYTGRVLDTQGNPVNGAAIRVGNETVYSDSEGRFMARFAKAGTQSLEVMIDEFLLPGKHTVVFCPPSISSSENVDIVVQ
jgi:hypothetical protein